MPLSHWHPSSNSPSDSFTRSLGSSLFNSQTPIPMRALAMALEQVPLLDLGMRLGEASGAAVAIPILRAAVACHAGMATFAEAGVRDRD